MSAPWIDICLTINLACTLYMVGLIWFVQVVHYPLMAKVGVQGYETYQQAHMRLTTWVVGPPMLLEAGTALGLVLLLPMGVQLSLAWRAFSILILVWLTTALFSVPAHQRLLQTFCPKAHRRLVQTNWLRTLGWTVRAVIVVCIYRYHYA